MRGVNHIRMSERVARGCGHTVAPRGTRRMKYINTRDEIAQGETGGSSRRGNPRGCRFQWCSDLPREKERESISLFSPLSLSRRSSRRALSSPREIELIRPRELRSCNRRQLDFNSIPFPSCFVVVAPFCCFLPWPRSSRSIRSSLSLGFPDNR